MAANGLTAAILDHTFFMWNIAGVIIDEKTEVL
jgi:hypothetical protein